MAFLMRIGLSVFLAALAWCAHADEPLALHEQEIKAGLLYNFLKYIEWPHASMAGASMVVCIFGADPFEGYLQPLAGRVVNQREITLRAIHTPQEAERCHLLFINSAEKDHWPQLRSALAGKSVLTVSEFGDFTALGGMIAFGHRDDHINVAFNTEAAAAAQLRVQERLLKLVTVVHPAAGGGQ